MAILFLKSDLCCVQVLYVDHLNQRTTYTDPRLAFAAEKKTHQAPFRWSQRLDGKIRWHSLYQCGGSGIRCFFDPGVWIGDPGWKKIRIRYEHPRSFFQGLRNSF